MLYLFIPLSAFLLIGEPVPKLGKEALQPLQALVGNWKATGTPEGSREEKQKGFWTENIACAWQFKGQDVSLQFTLDKGKHFTKADLRYLPESKIYELTATTAENEKQTFVGSLTEGKQKQQVLTLDRSTKSEMHRVVVTILHNNRFLYYFETKPLDGTSFTRKFQVGATKEGEPFANVGKGNECIVSGGRGTIPVTHAGKTYYVCCTGCKDAFKEDPETYIKEYEAKLKKEKK